LKQRAQSIARTTAATGLQLRVATGLGADLTAGDSIAVNGVCLTVALAARDGFDAIVSPETLRVTTLGTLEPGPPRKPRAATQGRCTASAVISCWVTSTASGRIRSLDADGDCYWLDVETPTALAPLVILKGSITVDGISLTVADLLDDRVRIQIVPFTFAHTALKSARAGDAVNIEADVIGKYVARLMQTGALRDRRGGDRRNLMTNPTLKLAKGASKKTTFRADRRGHQGHSRRQDDCGRRRRRSRERRRSDDGRVDCDTRGGELHGQGTAAASSAWR
jgi:riboflavin synthase